MSQRAASDKNSCSALVYKQRMALSDMCCACFELDQHDKSFWRKKGVDTKLICHKIYPEKAIGWKPIFEGKDYWQVYKQSKKENEGTYVYVDCKIIIFI